MALKINPGIEKRLYQISLAHELSKPGNHIAYLPYGSGKTIIAIESVAFQDYNLGESDRNVLIIAPSLSLKQQWNSDISTISNYDNPIMLPSWVYIPKEFMKKCI